MTREIKFRAWDKKNKIMFQVQRISFNSYGIQQEILLKVGHELDRSWVELMQFTGLKDKNGKEIFEGDIIEFTHLDKEFKNEIMVVIWGEKDCGFYAENPSCSTNSHGIDCCNLQTIKGKVIGNKFEDSHLLKNGK